MKNDKYDVNDIAKFLTEDPDVFAASEESPAVKKNWKALEGIPQHEINFYAKELDKYEEKGIVGIEAAKDIVKRFGNDASWLLKYFNYNA